MDKEKIIFPRGIRFYKPRDNAPETIKGNIVIDLKELLAFCAEQGIEETLRVDLRKSKEKGTMYFSLNTWKPTSDIPKKENPF